MPKIFHRHQKKSSVFVTATERDITLSKLAPYSEASNATAKKSSILSSDVENIILTEMSSSEPVFVQNKTTMTELESNESLQSKFLLSKSEARRKKDKKRTNLSENSRDSKHKKLAISFSSQNNVKEDKPFYKLRYKSKRKNDKGLERSLKSDTGLMRKKSSMRDMRLPPHIKTSGSETLTLSSSYDENKKSLDEPRRKRQKSQLATNPAQSETTTSVSVHSRNKHPKKETSEKKQAKQYITLGEKRTVTSKSGIVNQISKKKIIEKRNEGNKKLVPTSHQSPLLNDSFSNKKLTLLNVLTDEGLQFFVRLYYHHGEKAMLAYFLIVLLTIHIGLSFIYNLKTGYYFY